MLLSHYTVSTVMGLLLLCGCAASPEATEKSPTTSRKPTAQAPQGTARGSMRAYIDPETGQITDAPRTTKDAPIELSPEMENAMSTSSEGLVEEKSSLPGGGDYIELKGRFQSPLIGIQDRDKKIDFVHPVHQKNPSKPGKENEKQ